MTGLHEHPNGQENMIMHVACNRHDYGSKWCEPNHHVGPDSYLVAVTQWFRTYNVKTRNQCYEYNNAHAVKSYFSHAT